MKPVVLVGAGGHGRGVLEILLARAAAGLDTPPVHGFVDDDPVHTGKLVGGLPVHGTVDWLVARATEFDALLAIASPRAKLALAARLDVAGVGWATAVHPSVICGTGVVVDPGAIVSAGVVVAYDTRIGRHTTVNLNATIGHDCLVGDFSTVAPGVNVTGHVTLELGVEVQTNATIVPGLALGAWSRVGPGSVVLRDVAAGESVFGNPARKMPA